MSWKKSSRSWHRILLVIYMSVLSLSSGIESEWKCYSASHSIEKNASVLVWIQLYTFTNYCDTKSNWSEHWAKWVTLVYLYHVNRWDTHKKLSIAKLDFVQVCGPSLNFYNNNTLRKFYKFSDSRQTWTNPTLQSADWPISRQYHRPQMRKRVSYSEVY